ncbi:MAG: hypothetical protein J0I28_12360 [Caulobacterales bacterium]|nr:hypothetical protein [Caulobacterales bacterium]
MNRIAWRAAFAIGGALALLNAWRRADELLQALRLAPRLTDISAGVWLLLAASLLSVVLSLVALMMAWRALQARRLRPMLIWLAVGAAVAPALFEGAGALAERLG